MIDLVLFPIWMLGRILVALGLLGFWAVVLGVLVGLPVSLLWWIAWTVSGWLGMNADPDRIKFTLVSVAATPLAVYGLRDLWLLSIKPAYRGWRTDTMRKWRGHESAEIDVARF